jgi:hypothetical protein
LHSDSSSAGRFVSLFAVIADGKAYPAMKARSRRMRFFVYASQRGIAGKNAKPAVTRVFAFRGRRPRASRSLADYSELILNAVAKLLKEHLKGLRL